MPQKFDLIISVVNYNGEEDISQCLDFLLKACKNINKKIKIICTDNNSFDLSKEMINNYGGIEKIFLNQNIGYAAAHNQVLRKWDAEYFLLLNPDAFMEDEYNLVKMLKYLDTNPEIAIATCNTLDENHTLMPSIASQPTVINGIFEQLKFSAGLRYSRTKKNLTSKLSKVLLARLRLPSKTPKAIS